MAREFSRRHRVAEEIKKELGVLMATQVKDPAVRLAAITDVTVSPDLKHAKVYVGVFDVIGDPNQAEQVLAGLRRARGFLKHELGKRIRLRVLPELRFYEDTTEREAQRLSRVIESAVAEDERHHGDDEGGVQRGGADNASERRSESE